MKTYVQLIEECLSDVKEVMPWDLEELIDSDNPPMLLDIREPYEFEALRIRNSINVPRGILESACDYDYEETVPELAGARDKPIVVICRSGYRSVLAAYTMQLMGYTNVFSLKTGVKGWNDSELPLIDNNENDVDIDDADKYFVPKLRPEQLSKNHQ